jgi:hypothetical protein
VGTAIWGGKACQAYPISRVADRRSNERSGSRRSESEHHRSGVRRGAVRHGPGDNNDSNRERNRGGDLVKAGLIQSLERPGGNVIGMWLTSDEAAAARVETLKKMMPSMIKLVVLASATYPENQLLLPVAEGAAKRLGIAMQT